MSAPKFDPAYVEAVGAEIEDAYRRADEEPDQRRKLGKHFEDVLDTLHNNPSRANTSGPSVAEREEDRKREAMFLGALQHKLGEALKSQGLRLVHLAPDGDEEGFFLVAADGANRQFEVLFSYAEGSELSGHNPHGMVDRIVESIHGKILGARDNYYRRALLTS